MNRNWMYPIFVGPLLVGFALGGMAVSYLAPQSPTKAEPRQIMTTQMADGVRCYEFPDQRHSALSCVKVTP